MMGLTVFVHLSHFFQLVDGKSNLVLASYFLYLSVPQSLLSKTPFFFFLFIFAK